jgi:hypothetical protein
MLKRYGKCIALCVCFLIVGFLIGGCIGAGFPRPNHIHLIVMPYQEVNLAPEYGDILDWVPYNSKQSLSIQYTFEVPCAVGTTAPNTCIFNGTNHGIYTYTCNGQSPCPDPGTGPSCKSCSKGGKVKYPLIFSGIFNIFNAIDTSLGLIPKPAPPPSSTTPPGGGGPVQLAATAPPPATVGCDANQSTKVVPTNITAGVNQTISWVGANDFTLAINQTKCQGDTSKLDTIQQCTLLSQTPFTYSATDVSCTNTPTITTPTITPQ